MYASAELHITLDKAFIKQILGIGNDSYRGDQQVVAQIEALTEI